MKKVIILFGKPGAGKGTRLSEFLQGREESFEVLSVGNLLRKEIKQGTELGKKAQTYMNNGELVPDEIINNIVINSIKQSDKAIITDGFPRTVVQAEEMIKGGVTPSFVVHFYVDDEVVIQRAKDRIICEECGEPYTTNEFKRPKQEGICDKCGGKLCRRPDDEEEAVKKRLEVYEKETYPVLDVLKGAGVEIYSINNTCENAGVKFEKMMSE